MDTQSFPRPIDKKLICACAAAYAIDPKSGHYKRHNFYADQVGYASTGPGIENPQAISGRSNPEDRLINACLVGRTDKEIIVSFRGTLFGEDTASIQDWVQDFFMDVRTAPGFVGEVHSGFYEATKSIHTQVIEQIELLLNGDNLPIYVTGHSKGGGMAPIFAWWLGLKNIKIKEVVTFAAPLCGNVIFATEYDKKFTTYRYENYGDLVPLVPPEKEFFQYINLFVEWLPDMQWLQKLLNEAEIWNYATVGNELFIPLPTNNQYIIKPGEDAYTRIFDVITNIINNDFDLETALLSAHSIACNSAYFTAITGISGQSCPAQDEDVARMPAITKASGDSTVPASKDAL